MDDKEKARQAVIFKMTQMAQGHMADVYSGEDGEPVLEGEPAALFALVTDAAYAYLASLEGKATLAGVSPMEALMRGLRENLEEPTMKPDDPTGLPVNGWVELQG